MALRARDTAPFAEGRLRNGLGLLPLAVRSYPTVTQIAAFVAGLIWTLPRRFLSRPSTFQQIQEAEPRECPPSHYASMRVPDDRTAFEWSSTMGSIPTMIALGLVRA